MGHAVELETTIDRFAAEPAPGAIKLARRYGDALVCVRYRHNPQGTHRYTTVELVVDAAPVAHRVPPDSSIVLVRLDFDDYRGRRRALAQGANWDGEVCSGP